MESAADRSPAGSREVGRRSLRCLNIYGIALWHAVRKGKPTLALQAKCTFSDSGLPGACSAVSCRH